ncbi:MAG: type II toxin-antitoxin system PemK/MazF family toxin [Patescibacteria group bacterium]
MKQYEIYLANLDPTIGHEIKKTRPCLIVSPDEMNDSIRTVIIAPMTTQSHPFPTRVPVRFKDNDGWIVLDQLHTLDKLRLVKKLGAISPVTICTVKQVLKEMLVD